MMRLLRKLGLVLTATIGLVVVLGVVGFVLSFFGPFGFPLLVLLGLSYGWVLYAYLHYRLGRQDEVVQLLAATAEARAPLGQALEAYVAERPEVGWRKFWAIVILFIILPGYYWIWHKRHGFDRKVRRVAALLDEGVPLPEALATVRGVVPDNVVLSAAVGESTGRLPECLRRSVRGQLGPLWLEALPRLLYPLALLFFVLGILAFWATFLFPRMERIFHDLGTRMPQQTEDVAALANLVVENPLAIGLAFFAVVGFVFLLVFVPTVRYYTPVLGRIYEMSVQSRVMTMLGVLLETGRTVPDALELLAAQEEPGGFVGRRLQQVKAAVCEGAPLAESLDRAGLLPWSAAVLLQSGERAQNLPWVMAELGEQLAARTARLAQRVSLALFPISVAAIGALIAFLVLGMFMPLVRLLLELTQ
jgi:type II secretory pathway component PulF